MRVLVTGHRGYIGSVLTCVLRNQRFEVCGLDSDLFAGCDFGRVSEDVPGYDMDVRDVDFADLISFDAVVHLAGLSDDACGMLNPDLTQEINVAATQRLAECCKKAQVSRFVFMSSCSVYGPGGSGLLDESGPVSPLTTYAESKLEGERVLAELAGPDFSPVSLRCATVYGVSPRLRLDTVVNDFTAAATTTGRVGIRSAGQAWRPVVHVEDVARVIAAALLAPDEQVRGEVFNLARSDQNLRVIDIADEVTDAVPYSTRGAPQPMYDLRSYRADGAKLTRTFPDLKMRWALPAGIRQLHNAMTGSGLTPGDWRCDRYRRAPCLRRQMEEGLLDGDLRRAQQGVLVNA